MSLFNIIKSSTYRMSLFLLNNYRIILATTRTEIKRRYAGSVFGKTWAILYPLLFLSMYLFLYLVVFQVRFPQFSQLEYVLYVFCGLVPYLAFMECMNFSGTCLKQNIELVKNVVIPIEIIPVRTVLMTVISEMVGIIILALLAAINGSLSLHILWLPLIIFFQVIAFMGIAWLISPLGILFPDINYITNLFVIFLLFISPIGYQVDMLNGQYLLVVYANPIYYMLEIFRSSILYGELPSLTIFTAYVGICLILFITGCTVFSKFKDIIMDYE